MATATSLTRNYMRESGLRDSLNCLVGVIKSCYGPHSRLKLLQNEGGHATLTSSSGRLLNLVLAEESVTKVIINAVKKHVQLNIDGGLFCLLLTSTLIKDALELSENKILVSNIYRDLHKIIEEYFSVNDCPIGVRKIDFSNLHDLMQLTKSIIKPKSGCVLNDDELDLVCRTLVETFIKTFSAKSSNSVGDVQIISLVGLPPSSIRFIEGLLIRADNVEENFSVFDDLSDRVKFVIVTTSLAGDHGDEDDIAYAKKEDAIMDDVIDEGVYGRIVPLCDRWAERGVRLVLCQKVVHWRVVEYLKKRGVLVLQRLGLQTTQYALKMTGGIHVCSILQPEDDEDSQLLFELKSIDLVEYCHQRFYQLNVDDCTRVSTLLVVNATEESQAELQYVCRVALDSMRMAARHPRLISGSGHFEKETARVLRQRIRQRYEKLIQIHQCTRIQLYTITEQFCRSLLSTTVTLNPLSQSTPNSHNLLNEFLHLSLNETETDRQGSESETESNDCVDLLCIKLAACHTAVFTACGLIQVDGLFDKEIM